MTPVGPHPRRLRHGLADHPQLTTAALAVLAARLPPKSIEHHLADLPLLLPMGVTTPLELPADEVIRGLAGNGCWVMLGGLESDADYLPLVRRVIADEGGDPMRAEGGMAGLWGTAFLSSPGAVVPAHVDRHHNLLLQVAGSKRVVVGDVADHASRQRAAERRVGPAQLNCDELPPASETFELGPGDGLYVPPYTIHWVIGGDDVSISLSCWFTTPATIRAELVHRTNGYLRRVGLQPRPPGHTAARDRAKVAALKAGGRLRQLARR